jgi:hypothetical protein
MEQHSDPVHYNACTDTNLDLLTLVLAIAASALAMTTSPGSTARHLIHYWQDGAEYVASELMMLHHLNPSTKLDIQ